MNKKHAAKLNTAIAKARLVLGDAQTRSDGTAAIRASQAIDLLESLTPAKRAAAARAESVEAAEATVDNGG